MSKIKQSLNEDFSVLTGQELDEPTELDYLTSDLRLTALKISKLDNIVGYEDELKKTIELLTLMVDVSELKAKVDSQKAPF